MLVTIVKIATLLTMILSCLIFFILIRRILNKTGNIGDLAKNQIDNLIKSKGVMSAYKIKLSKMGVMYRAKDYNLNPSWYVMIRVTTGVIVSIIAWFIFEKIIVLPIGMIGGYFLIDFYFKRKNIEDNKEIKFDLYNAYVNLKIQLSAGMYIANSLEYTHKTAQNKRFKEALGELIINFADKTVSMSDAIGILKNRFDSKDIDKFCALIQSCVSYGAQEAYLKDIMNEIRSIALANTKEIEDNIENKSSFIVFLFFVILLAITLYTMVLNFTNMIDF